MTTKEEKINRVMAANKIETELCTALGLIKKEGKTLWEVPEGFRLNQSKEYFKDCWTHPEGIGLDYDRRGNPIITAKMADMEGYGEEKKLTGIYPIPVPVEPPVKKETDNRGNPLGTKYDPWGNPVYGDGEEYI